VVFRILLVCLLAQQLPRPDRMGVTNTGPYDYGVMGPPATPAIVTAADQAVTKPIPAGPFQPSWESIAANFRVPSWFADTKFGIFMHWGVYSAAAHHNEWYEKHMYAAAVRKRGLRFALSNHGVENFTFMNPALELRDRLLAAKADLYDPAWAAFYNVAGRGWWTIPLAATVGATSRICGW
jgi:hypothetical protein